MKLTITELREAIREKELLVADFEKMREDEEYATGQGVQPPSYGQVARERRYLAEMREELERRTSE